MTDWTSHLSNYASFCEMETDLKCFRSRLGFHADSSKKASYAATLQKLVSGIDLAEKALAYYLFQLSHMPGKRILSQQDVVCAFDALVDLWKAIPDTEQTRFIIMHPMPRYGRSVRELLSNPDTLKADQDAYSSTAPIIDEYFS